MARARPSQVRVTLGEYVLKSNAEPLPGRTYGASNIKVHPYFKFTPQADRFDVAVVRLNRRVDMAPHISPLCLPPKSMDMHGLNGWASGWGALQPGSRLRPKTLQVCVLSGAIYINLVISGVCTSIVMQLVCFCALIFKSGMAEGVN